MYRGCRREDAILYVFFFCFCPRVMATVPRSNYGLPSSVQRLTFEIYYRRRSHPYRKMPESCKVGKKWMIVRDVIRMLTDVWFEYPPPPRISKDLRVAISKRGIESMPLRGAWLSPCLYVIFFFAGCRFVC